MTATERHDLLTRAIRTWGETPQMDMVIEEMAELTKAILKLRRTSAAEGATDEDFQRIRGERIDDIVEEMADVQIMLDQLRIILGRSTDSVEEEKLVRLKARLDAGDAREAARWASPLMEVFARQKGGDSHAEG